MIIINKSIPAIFLDRNEREINSNDLLKGRFSSIPCDETEDDFLDNSFVIFSETITTQCSTGTADNAITVDYRVSTAFDILASNPSNSSQTTRGRFRIKRVTNGEILYTNSNIAINSENIVLIGNDPSYPEKKIYKITYTVIVTDPAHMENTYFEHRPIVYSSCPDAVITPGEWIKTPYRLAVGPCNKLDVIRISHSASDGRNVYFSGCDAGVQYGQSSCYFDQSTRPNEHEVWWKAKEDPVGAYSQIRFPGIGDCNAQIRNLRAIITSSFSIPTSGQINIKYRNVKRTTNSNCPEPTSLECVGPFSEEMTLTIP